MKEYILINRMKHADYFMCNLKDTFVPIVFDNYVESYLISKGVKVVGILKYITDKQRKQLILESYHLADNFIAKIDEHNKLLYKEIFGTERIDFFYATIGFFFRAFMANCFSFLKGLESIVKNELVQSICYLHDDHQDFICGNRQEKAFSFPGDIYARIIECWDYPQKPILKKVEITPGAFSLMESEENVLEEDCDTNTLKKKVIALKQKIRKETISFVFENYNKRKKTLLLLYSPYDLEFILNPGLASLINTSRIRFQYNVISWDIDNSILPDFIKGFPIQEFQEFFNDTEKSRKLNYEEMIKSFNFDNVTNIYNSSVNLNFSYFTAPLIENFLKRKINNIIEYWRVINSLHNIIRIDALLWGNSPVRYPSGIVVEFCRRNGIPVLGMQHGGVYGSNIQVGDELFHSDFKHCDYYLSYGFNENSFAEYYHRLNKFPKVIPVGSTKIVYFLKMYSRSCRLLRPKIKILYTVNLTEADFFTQGISTIHNLFNFQREIIKVLTLFSKFKIVIQFYPGTYRTHELMPYIKSFAHNNFIVENKTTFKECLKKYDVETILIEQQSTPLNEAVGTKANIILYNDENFSPLTKEAYEALTKRAIICDTKERFFKCIRDCLNNKIEQRDLEDRAFLEKYSVYKGEPEKNITKEIASILG